MSFSRLSTVARGILRTCAIVLARTGEHATVRNKTKSQSIDRSRYRGAVKAQIEKAIAAYAK
jgi:hypothetical protein